MKKDVTTYSIFILLLFLSMNKVFASTSTDNNSMELWSSDTSHITADNFLNYSKRFKTECNEQKMARACFAYATYLYVESELYKQSYDYFVTAFDLGQKESGAYIAGFQINHPEMFNNNERLSIDESIYYAEQVTPAVKSVQLNLGDLITQLDDNNQTTPVLAIYSPSSFEY